MGAKDSFAEILEAKMRPAEHEGFSSSLGDTERANPLSDGLFALFTEMSSGRNSSATGSPRGTSVKFYQALQSEFPLHQQAEETELEGEGHSPAPEPPKTVRKVPLKSFSTVGQMAFETLNKYANSQESSTLVSLELLKSLHRKAVKRLHPDRNGGQFVEDFIAAQGAAEILMNEFIAFDDI